MTWNGNEMATALGRNSFVQNWISYKVLAFEMLTEGEQEILAREYWRIKALGTKY